MTLQPLPNISRLPSLDSIASGQILDLLDESVPAEIRAVLTGFLTEGLIGGLDSAVFNQLDKIPTDLLGLSKTLYDTLPDLESLNVSSITKSALELFANEGSTEGILGALSGGLSLLEGGGSIGGLLDGLGPTTQLLQQFGSFAGFAIPGLNVVKTASTIMSVLGIGGDLGFLGGQGLGLDGVVGIFGSPASVVTSLIAPSVSKLFGGLFGGKAQDPRKTCPCLEICRKTDHFISEDSTVLLKTCAPVLNSSVIGSGFTSGGGGGFSFF